MIQKNNIELVGRVTEVLPNTMFRVEVEGKKIILCHLSGKMRINYIKIMPGDKVRIEVTPYDLNRGRITYRLS
jgi:translation initiation factor IF-1